MTEQYGNSQIKEMIFSQKEIENIIIENILRRTTTPYDFDYKKPYILWDNENLILRFVQTKVTLESKPRDFYFKEIK